MSKNTSSKSACAFDLVLCNAPSSLWITRDVASLLSVRPGAAAHMAGHLDLKVVLKSAWLVASLAIFSGIRAPWGRPCLQVCAQLQYCTSSCRTGDATAAAHSADFNKQHL
jgi:hypothetical protein